MRTLGALVTEYARAFHRAEAFREQPAESPGTIIYQGLLDREVLAIKEELDEAIARAEDAIGL